MAEDPKGGRPLSEEELQEMVASADAGARNPAGSVGTLLAIVYLILIVVAITIFMKLVDRWMNPRYLK